MRAWLVVVMALVLALPSQVEARKRPLPLGGELRLDLADPIVTARIGDVALRLRVDFDQRDSIELNPEAAARLPLPFEPGGDAEVGRVLLPGRMAMARLTIAGQEAEIQLATHDRTCCEGADGAIGAALMPFETVRLVGRDAPLAAEQVFAMEYSRDGGLVIRQPTPAGAVLVQFSLDHEGALATKSAGTILLRAYGGRLQTGYSRVAGPFGVERPVRALALDRPARLAGFTIHNLQVRTADFGGRRAFPEEGPRPGDILVRKRVRAHHDWPAILLGREYIGRCSEIVFKTISRTLSLRCPSS